MTFTWYGSHLKLKQYTWFSNHSSLACDHCCGWEWPLNIPAWVPANMDRVPGKWRTAICGCRGKWELYTNYILRIYLPHLFFKMNRLKLRPHRWLFFFLIVAVYFIFKINTAIYFPAF